MKHETTEYQELLLTNLRVSYSKSIASTVDVIVASSGNIFLSYMALRFSKEKKGSLTNDPILGRKVPSIVYL